jgi:hypothetical protein
MRLELITYIFVNFTVKRFIGLDLKSTLSIVQKCEFFTILKSFFSTAISALDPGTLTPLASGIKIYVRAGNTNLSGRLRTVNLLIKEACFVKKE